MHFYRLGVAEQALGGIPLGFGIVVEDKPSELSCIIMLNVCVWLVGPSYSLHMYIGACVQMYVYMNCMKALLTIKQYHGSTVKFEIGESPPE